MFRTDNRQFYRDQNGRNLFTFKFKKFILTRPCTLEHVDQIKRSLNVLFSLLICYKFTYEEKKVNNGK